MTKINLFEDNHLYSEMKNVQREGLSMLNMSLGEGATGGEWQGTKSQGLST